MVKQAAWQEGKLRTMLFEPFEILRDSSRKSQVRDAILESDYSGRTRTYNPSVNSYRSSQELAV
jgi:hypothetical protein